MPSPLLRLYGTICCQGMLQSDSPEAGALYDTVVKSADQFPADHGEHHRNPDERQIYGMK